MRLRCDCGIELHGDDAERLVAEAAAHAAAHGLELAPPLLHALIEPGPPRGPEPEGGRNR
jgi:hypothetical protein